MHDADRQKTSDIKRQELLDEFEVELSDLPPSERSHYALLRLNRLRETLRTTGQMAFERVRDAMQETRQAERQETNDEFEIEFSDLPPSRRSHYWLMRLLTLKERFQAFIRPARQAQSAEQAARNVRHPVRARVGQTFSALALCATLLVLLLGNAPDLRNRLLGFFQQAAPTATPATSSFTYSSIRVIVNGQNGSSVVIGVDTPGTVGTGELGAHPSTCPKANSLQNFDAPLELPGVGAGPLWMTGFSGPTATIVHLAPAPDAAPGWYETLTLFIRKGATTPIMLQGGSQTSGDVLEFSDPQSLAPVDTTFTLDPGTTTHDYRPQGEWEATSMNIYVPRAGCYYLQASWPGSTWMIYFAAGR